MRENFSSAAVANIPITINETGVNAIEKALAISNLVQWSRFKDEGNNVANDAGHRCGPGRNFNSLDSDTVDNLRRYVNDGNGVSDLLAKHSKDFLDNVKDPNKNCAEYFKSLVDNKNNIQGTQTNELNVQHTKYVEEYQSTIMQLNNLISERTITLGQKKKDLAASQEVLRQKQAELATEQGYLNVTGQLQEDATSNVNVLDKYKASLTNNIKTNTEFLSYLNDRITVTKGISLDNYEELYKSVILQNGILDNTVKEMNQNIVNANRDAEKVSKKKDSMHSLYITLTVIYCILVVIFLIFLVFYQTGWSNYFKIFTFIVAVVFPFVIGHIEDAVYNMWRYLLAVLSGSVYT